MGPCRPQFCIVWGGAGATILLQGHPWRLFKPLLELSWNPLVAPGPLWARFGTRYGASGRIPRGAGIPGALAPIRPPSVQIYLFLTYFTFGPVSVLQGSGRDVRSVHAGACFVRVRQIQQDSLLRQLWGARARNIEPRARERSTRTPRVAPESLDVRQTRVRAVPRGLSQTEK